ncbi:hypothetical protein mRhiFer1_008136 [Rhinolophus ferrumequinum]|uniref:Translation elongation factor EF1B beta/delta subunit guanine nucleotide exchange domain-containing protein n=1 Tax=Rhinolophus ferrumequinum TaxID=59479 RepID=A0A7J7W830_RHIFE|nr:hypothetical protein mRhiFer1_008136 [Rhinolophus ferrumequinum]
MMTWISLELRRRRKKGRSEEAQRRAPCAVLVKENQTTCTCCPVFHIIRCETWDDETDVAKLDECVRSMRADGLVWGSSKLVPAWYGIKKLQIQCVVEDDNVGNRYAGGADHCFGGLCVVMHVAAFSKI